MAGRFAEPTVEDLKLIDPTSERPVWILHESSADEDDRAVMAARATVAERQKPLMAIHDLILAPAQEIAEVETINTGIPLPQTCRPRWSRPTIRSPSSRKRFGPFATIQMFDDEDEAIARNDCKLGIVGYVWSGDLKRAMRTAGALRTGTVMVNMPIVRNLRTGCGGHKQSGLGREGARGSQAVHRDEDHRAGTPDVPAHGHELRGIL